MEEIIKTFIKDKEECIPELEINLAFNDGFMGIKHLICLN